jgi:hypothetical protein
MGREKSRRSVGAWKLYRVSPVHVEDSPEVIEPCAGTLSDEDFASFLCHKYLVNRVDPSPLLEPIRQARCGPICRRHSALYLFFYVHRGTHTAATNYVLVFAYLICRLQRPGRKIPAVIYVAGTILAQSPFWARRFGPVSLSPFL